MLEIGHENNMRGATEIEYGVEVEDCSILERSACAQAVGNADLARNPALWAAKSDNYDNEWPDPIGSSIAPISGTVLSSAPRTCGKKVFGRNCWDRTALTLLQRNEATSPSINYSAIGRGRDIFLGIVQTEIRGEDSFAYAQRNRASRTFRRDDATGSSDTHSRH